MDCGENGGMGEDGGREGFEVVLFLNFFLKLSFFFCVLGW